MTEFETESPDEPISGTGADAPDAFPSGDPDITDSIEDILHRIADDPERAGLENTPERVSGALEFLTSGYDRDPGQIIEGALYKMEYDEMVLVKEINFYSLCEHHMLPFYGQVHVAYVPDQHVVGLSKISRLVNVFARRLQVQERLTTNVARTLQEKVKPKGVGVVVEGKHLCMMMRGVQKQNARAVTSSMLDLFRRDSRTRMEFLELLDLN